MPPGLSQEPDDAPGSAYALALVVRRTPAAQRCTKFHFSAATVRRYLKLTSGTLLPEVVQRLEELQAPRHAWFWVSQGATPARRIVRMALAVVLRRGLKNEDRPSRALTNMVWIRNEHTRAAETVFRTLSAGKALYAWVQANYEAAQRTGAWSDKFWDEVERRALAAAEPLPTFWAAVEARAAGRPKIRRRRNNTAIPEDLAQGLALLKPYFTGRALRVLCASPTSKTSREPGGSKASKTSRESKRTRRI